MDNRTESRVRAMVAVAMFSGWLLVFCGLLCGVQAAAQPARLPVGVRQVCAISFAKDRKFAARVEDSAAPCLRAAARVLAEHPGEKLVLIGTADLKRDSQTLKNGSMREGEDTTGADVRFEDLAAYRAINTKSYLVQWNRIDPARILPTTNEWIDGQSVSLYLVPGDADFNHNYLDTTKINENPCTVEPCYSPDEETLKAQDRGRIRK